MQSAQGQSMRGEFRQNISWNFILVNVLILVMKKEKDTSLISLDVLSFESFLKNEFSKHKNIKT